MNMYSVIAFLQETAHLSVLCRNIYKIARMEHRVCSIGEKSSLQNKISSFRNYKKVRNKDIL